MAADYPAAIVGAPGTINESFDGGKTYASITAADKSIPGNYLNKLAAEIRAIEQTLGINPQGSQATVLARLAVALQAGGSLVAGIVGLNALASLARPRQNFLINGGHALNQRHTCVSGTYSADLAADAYSLDRWKVHRENAAVQSTRFDTASGGLETGLSNRFYGRWKKVTSTGKFIVCQPIEGGLIAPLRSRTVILQMLVKAISAKTLRVGLLEHTNASANAMDTIPAAIVPTTWGANATDPTFDSKIGKIAPTSVLGGVSTPIIANSAGSFSVDTTWRQISAVFTVPSNSKNLIPAIWTDSQFAAGDHFSIAEAGLYDGDELRIWLPNNPADDVLFCQRYYEKSYGLEQAAAGSITAGLQLYAGIISPYGNNLPYGRVTYKVNKRTDSPSITIRPFTTHTNTGRVSGNDGADLAGSSGATGVVNSSGFGVYNSSGGTVSPSANIVIFHWEADAEL